MAQFRCNWVLLFPTLVVVLLLVIFLASSLLPLDVLHAVVLSSSLLVHVGTVGSPAIGPTSVAKMGRNRQEEIGWHFWRLSWRLFQHLWRTLVAVLQFRGMCNRSKKGEIASKPSKVQVSR